MLALRPDRLQTLSVADQSFSLGRYHLAAQQYAAPGSTTSLEEVVLKFVEVDEKDALRFYLNAKFDSLPKTVRQWLWPWLRPGLSRTSSCTALSCVSSLLY